MIIYLDVVLIENLCMNYIILFATGYLLRIKRNHIRIIVSALIGGIYSVLSYMQVVEIYTNFVFKIILSVVMVYIAYKPKDIRNLMKSLVFFYLVSFVFGGCSLALLYFVKPQEILIKNGIYIGTYPIKIIILGGLLGFGITAVAIHYIKMKFNKEDLYCNIDIFFNDKKVSTVALIDTGNMLKDPISRLPVIVVEKEILKDIFPKEILDNLEKITGGDVPEEIYNKEYQSYINKLKVIPFNSIGKSNGMLLGFKASKVEIVQEHIKKEINNIIVAIYGEHLSRKNQYFALIGLELLEGSEVINEFTTSVSR